MLSPDPRRYARYYQGDIGSGYPLPEEQRRGTNLPAELIKGAAMMGAFMLTTTLVTKGAAALSRRAAGATARIAARHAAARGYSRAYEYVASHTTPTLGKTIRQTSSIKNMVTRYRSWQSRAGIDVGAYTAWAQGSGAGYAAMSKAGAPLSGVSDRMRKFSQFFAGRGTPAFRGRVMGATESFFRDYAKHMPAIFVAGKAIDMLSGRQTTDRPTQWWNLPGHARNLAGDFARHSLSFLPMSLAFRGGIGGVKLSKDSIEYALRSGITRASGNVPLVNRLYGISSSVDILRTRLEGTDGRPGFRARFRGATSEFFRSFSARWDRGRLPKTRGTAKLWYENVASGWRKGKIKEMHRLTQIPKAYYMEDINKISGVPLGGQEFPSALADVMARYDRPNPGFLARVAGLQHLKLADRMAPGAVEDMMSRIATQNLTPELQESMRNMMQSKYYGKGIFTAGEGKSIDLSRWRPTEAISRSVDWANEHINLNIPFTKTVINPFQIFQTKRIKDWLLGKSPSVYEWRAGNRIRVGPLHTLGASDVAEGATPPGYNPYGATVTLQRGGYDDAADKYTDATRMLWIRSGNRRFGGGGRLFWYTPAKDNSYAKEVGAGKYSYKLVEQPPHGALRRIHDQFYGANLEPLDRFDATSPREEMQRLQEVLGWSKAKAWLDAMVLRTPSEEMRRNMTGKWASPGMEIGAGYGSVDGPMTRFGNLFRKYFNRKSPLVYMSDERGFLSELASRGKGPHNYVNEKNLEPTIHFLQGTRNALNNSLDESWHLLRRREIYEKYAAHRVPIPGMQTMPTLGEIFGDSPPGRKKLIDSVRGILDNEGDQPDWAFQKARSILEAVESDEGYWSHAVTKTELGRNLTAADELQKFVFRHHILAQAKDQRNYRYLQNLTRDIDVGRKGLFGRNKNATLLRSLDTLSRFEDIMGDMPLSQLPDMNTAKGRSNTLEKYFSNASDYTGGRVNEVMDYLMGERHVLSDLSRIFQPPMSTKLPNLIRAPIQGTTTSPYEVVIAGGFPSVREAISEHGLMKGMGSILSPRYMYRDEGGIMYPGSTPFTQPSRFMLEAVMRFERMGEHMGLGLNLGRRSTAGDVAAGMLSRIFIPALAAYSLWGAADTFTDVNPIFSGTSWDEGINVALAEQVVKHRMRTAKLYDAVGATKAFQHFEGLMPGLISSPASRIGMAVGPPLVGAMAGMSFGPTGGGVGLITGTAISAATGFGLMDLTKSEDDLEDVYSGRELVAHRRGSGWFFGRCTTANTMIMREYAICTAKDIDIGDRLTTSDGSLVEVLNIYKRKHTGTIINIYTTIDRNNPTSLTGNHMVPIIRFDRRDYKIGHRDGIVIDEVPAEDIAIKDWVEVPIPKLDTSLTHICATDYIYHDRYIVDNDIVYPAQVSSIGKKYIRDGNTLSLHIPLNYDIGKLFGYFLAEGSLIYKKRKMPCYIETVHGTEEEYIIDDISTIYKEYFGVDVKYKRSITTGNNPLMNPNDSYKGVIVVRAISSLLATLFYGIFYNSSRSNDKTFPDIFLSASAEFKEGLIEGYWRGDGHTDKGRKHISSCREEYLIHTRSILLSLGYLPTIPKYEVNDYRGRYKIGWVDSDRYGECNNFLRWGNRLFTRVIGLEVEEYDGAVYDFEVDHPSHLFQCGTFLVHNSLLSGDRIDYHRPNWFAKLKSQYKFTPTMYGSKLEEFTFRNPIMMPIALAADPYHWERKGYFSSPYPETGVPLESVPFVGPVLSTTLGRAIKPRKLMHRRALERSFIGTSALGGAEPGAGYMPPPGIQVDAPSPLVPATINERTGTGVQVRRPYPVSMHGLRQTVGRSVYRGWSEPAGLYGWASELAMGGTPFQSDTVMANAGERVSARREFWDLMNSGLGGMSEFPRRYYPRQQAQIERWNPLTNRMPGWLPGGIGDDYFIDFRSGDPYSKIPEGELRLPSQGNMAAYHVKLSMPFRASQMGRTHEEMVQFLTGTRPPASVVAEEKMEAGTVMHRMIQDELRRSNMLVKAEAPVFEPYSNITGTVDAIVRQGRKNVVLELKTTSSDKLAELSGPDKAHRSQINFYMKALGLREGFIMYLDRENPTMARTFPVGYSQGLYQADVARMQQARATASELLSSGYGYPGEAYSHLDRMKVLADVAPYSDQYKRQYQIVNQMDKVGLLTPEEHEEKIKIVNRRRSVVRTYDLYPRRFDMKGVFFPDEKYQQMSENQYIKAAAEYNASDRILGAAWEMLTHQRTLVHSKLLGMYTPREQYERMNLYGTKSSFWSEPVRDFVEPYIRASFATRGPGEGLVRGMQAGFLFGGPPGAAIGAGAYSVYGAVHGGYRWLTDSTYIPGNVQGKWDMWEYFDNLKYLKSRRLYQMTGEEDYASMMSETMVGMNPMNRGRSSFTQIARAVPYELRPYIFAFIEETDGAERERIASEVPPAVAQLLRIRWAQADGDKESSSKYMRDYRNSHDLTSYYKDHYLPEESNLAWHPSVQLGDVQMRTLEKSGIDAHSFGQGWYSQQRRIKYSALAPDPINITDTTNAQVYPELGLDRSEASSLVQAILKQYGATAVQVGLNITPGVGSRVTLDVSVDRSDEYMAAI